MKVGKLEIEARSMEECEKADIAVCVTLGTPTPFRDNVLAICADCGTPIIHRPYMPKRPRKVCIKCVAKRIAGGNAP